MDRIRKVDWESARTFPSGYRGQRLYHGEDALVLVSLAPVGATGPARHYHKYSQIYFVQHGELTIEIGTDAKRLPAGAAAFIPGGVPHRNWNAGSENAQFIEIIAPGVSPGDQISAFADDTDTHGLVYLVTDRAEPKPTNFPGFSTDSLIDHIDGAGAASINVSELKPGTSGPPTHVHNFDQFYYALEGILSAEIALDSYQVVPDTLVVIPAGVPHKVWNEGVTSSRHMTVTALPPTSIASSTESPSNISVQFAPTETRDRGSVSG